MGRIIISIVIFVIGFLFVKKPEIPNDLIGPAEFAERTFSGGSQTFYKLVGLLLIALSFLIITGLEAAFINWLLGFIYK